MIPPALTPAQIEEGRALEERTTPSPWRAINDMPEDSGWSVCRTWAGDEIHGDSCRQCVVFAGLDESEAKLIAWLRNNAPALLAAAEENARITKIVEPADSALGKILLEHDTLVKERDAARLAENIQRSATTAAIIERDEARADRDDTKQLLAGLVVERERLREALSILETGHHCWDCGCRFNDKTHYCGQCVDIKRALKGGGA